MAKVYSENAFSAQAPNHPCSVCRVTRRAAACVVGALDEVEPPDAELLVVLVSSCACAGQVG